MHLALFVTDLDNTLVGEDAAMVALSQHLRRWQQAGHTKVVYSTGRSLPRYEALRQEKSLLTPDALVTAVGTEIYDPVTSPPDSGWAEVISPGWDQERVAAIGRQFAALVPQPDTEQRPFKVSYCLPEDLAPPLLSQLEQRLREAGLSTQLVYSGGQDLDVLPATANKGAALAYLQQKWGISPAETLVCGDSGNDRALFSQGEERGIVVGNARPELLQWHQAHPSPHRYLAQGRCASGILEGLAHFGLLDTAQY
ncbi:MAG: sucrose-phosphate phosphatase [Nodosilinea sp.]